MAEKASKIDGHCHLFNLTYLISELLAIGHDAIFGGYPRKGTAPGGAVGSAPTTPAAVGAVGGDLLSFIKTLIGQISQVSQILFDSYEENYQLLRKNFLAVFKDETDLTVFPLMMDIYYMFDGYFTGPALAPQGAALMSSRPDPEKAFEAWYAEIRDTVLSSAKASRTESFSTYKSVLADPVLDRLGSVLDTLYEKFTKTSGTPYAGTGGSVESIGQQGLTTVMTPGFEQEIKDCIALQAAHKGKVFPFLAVDPRRPHIMDLVKAAGVFGVEGPLVSHDGPFYGIKLYPRLGYLPKDIEAIGLFEWCADNDMPITYHCNTGGFPDIPGWKLAGNSDPSYWGGYLTKYKAVNGGLRVDFAHFGDGNEDWRATITDFVLNKDGLYGDNAYSDIACYVHTTSLQNAKAVWDSNAGLRSKLLFGTDFDVMLLTKLPIDLQEYFRQYRTVFKDDPAHPYSDWMMNRAPRAFMTAANPGASAAGGTVAAGTVTAAGGETTTRRKLGREIRLGWLRDHPDSRDYSIFTTNISARHAALKVGRSVHELLRPVFSPDKGCPSGPIDLRVWCAPVEDQSRLGSCTANAAVGLVEYFERRTTGRSIDASRLFLYKVSRKLLGWTGDSGAYLRTTLESLVLFGVPPESYFPYDIDGFDNEPEAFAYAFAQNYKTVSYFRLDPAGTRPQELLLAIKTTLAAGYPSIFGFSVYDSMSEAGDSRGRVPYPARQDTLRGGHAVMAVGYDDAVEICNSAAGSTPTRGAILFRNSWGEEWGDGGYGWLPYAYVLEGLAVDWWSIVKQEWVDTGIFS
jgi:C1A family cysteine protease